MACEGYPSAQDAKDFKSNADTIKEVVISDDDYTSPAIDGEQKLTLTGINSIALDAINTYRRVNAGFYSTAPLLEDEFTYTVFQGGRFYAVNPPYQTIPGTIADPNNDINLQLLELPDEQFVRQEAGDGDSQLSGGNIWPLSSQETAQVGDVLSSDIKGIRDVVNTRILTINSPVAGTITDIDLDNYFLEIDNVSVAIYDSTFERLDPRAWGVKASGGVDDKVAWDRFFSWYSTQIVTITPSQGTPIYTAPKILPIRGVTNISDRVFLPDYIKADFSQLIWKRHPTWSAPVGRFMIDTNSLYQADFGGISVSDEDYFLRVKNPNLDAGTIFVKGVQASNSNFCIESECQSSIVEFSEFKFDKCKRAVTIVRGDQFIMRAGWISQAELTDTYGCTIQNNDSYLIMRDVLGVPTSHSGQEVAWINNLTNGRVDIFDSVRFGGEAGSCTAVNNFAKFTTTGTPTGVKIHDSQVYSVDTQLGSQTSCAIRLFELPNYVSFKNNRGLVLTEEVVTWGIGSSSQSKIDELLEQLDNFQYDYKNNLSSGVLSEYPDNLISLFSPRDPFALTSEPSATPGESISDTRLKPDNSGQYILSIRGRVNPGGSTEYESTWYGIITVFTGFNGSIIVNRMSATTLAEGQGGASFSSGFTVTPVFWNGTSEASEVPSTSTDNRIRIKVSGWQLGSEGAGFDATITRLI